MRNHKRVSQYGITLVGDGIRALEFLRSSHPYAVRTMQFHAVLFPESPNVTCKVARKQVARVLQRLEENDVIYHYLHNRSFCWKLTPRGAKLLGVPYIVSEPEVKDGSTSRQ